MSANCTDVTDGGFEKALDEGTLGEGYETVGVYNKGFVSDLDFEYELFIMSVGSEV